MDVNGQELVNLFITHTYSNFTAYHSQKLQIKDYDLVYYFGDISAINLEFSLDYQWPFTHKWTDKGNE
jgi:hypothetical protein